MTTPNDETVQYNIVLEAQKALIVLAELTNKTKSFADQVNYARNVVKQFGQDTGMGFQKAKATLSSLDKELSNTSASSVVFGSKGQDAWNKVGEASEKAATKSATASRIMSVAFGMLIHQGINLVINAFQSMFTMAIKGLRELETATYNLVNAERTLSQQGVDITPQGLDESIAKLQKLDPLLSKIQATEAVSRVSSLVAPAVGLNAKEIDQLTQAIAVLAVKNKGLGKSFEEVESQVSNAFLSGKVSVGINQLGVKITDQIVKDEALRLGLVKTADEYDKLTGKMQANIKARAMLSVLTQATSKDVAHLPEFFKTADAQFTIFQARMQDFFTSLGTAAAPMLIKIFSFLAEGFQKATEWTEKNRDSLTLWFDVLGNVVVITAKVLGFLLKIGTAFGYVGIAIGNATDKLQKFIDKTPWLKKIADALGFKGIGEAPDTPTGVASEFSASSESAKAANRAKMLKEQEDKLTEIFKDARDKRLDIDRDYQNKLQDIALNYAQKLEDIARSTAQKTADAQRDYGDKVEDINRDADQRRSDAIEESHRHEIEQEQQYQDRLKALREKYLMDLEDALHERDARQILRLMRQYEIDKANAVKERNQQRQESQQNLEIKLQDIEKERQIKLQQAQRDLEDKLRDIRIAAGRERQEAAINRQRQLNDAAIAHRRALEEQRIYLQRKLRDLAEALAKEYGMTASALQALDNLYNAAATNAYGSASSPSSVNAGTYTPTSSSSSTVSSTWAAAGMYGTSGMAEGGTFLATRPATINVAENRPEVITATPLGKPGADVSKIFANGGLGGMGGGQIEIAMSLSPDLEARVIKNTLDETANIVTRINRSKS